MTISTHSNKEELFTNLFVVLWLGPLLISANSKLLGARMYIFNELVHWFSQYV